MDKEIKMDVEARWASAPEFSQSEPSRSPQRPERNNGTETGHRTRQAAGGLETEPVARTVAGQPNKGLAGLIGSGLIAALISSLCCVPAAVAFALGLSGSAFLVGLGLYRPYFLTAGLGVAALAAWWTLRRSRRCCSPADYQRNRILIPGLMLTTFLASYALINLALLPWLYG